MSVDGEGSNENKPQTQQTSSQHLTHQDLNFSLNDILSTSHDVNDSSFQSIVQTLSNNSNNDHIAPTYEHLPAELQDLFNTNETDDLLSVQNNHSDASAVLQENMTHIWHRPDIQSSQPFISSPQTPNVPPVTPSTPTTTPSPALSQPTIQQQATPTIQQEPQQQQQQSSTTLLDNITAQLPPDRKGRFVQLFRELQTNSVSATEFLTQAKSLLGSQQYQQLEDLKHKPAQQQTPVPVNNTNNSNDMNRKRPLTSSQIRAEDAQRSMPGIITPTLKRPKTENIPQPSFHTQTPQQQQQLQHLQMQLQQQHHLQMMQQQQQLQQQQQQQTALAQHQPVQPITQPPTMNITQPTPMFKTPAIPGTTTSLQVPTKTGTTTPATPSANTSTANTSSGGGGGDRIDYDTLTDVMGYAGVDLKEETEHFMKDGDGPGGILPDGVDRSKVQDFMNTDMLRAKIVKYAKGVDIKEIDGDFVSYIALATQDRIRTMMEAMVAASKHRTFDPFGEPPLSKEGHPLFKIQVKQNVKSQLEAIEHVSRLSELDLDPVDDEEDEKLSKKNSSRASFQKGWHSNRSKLPLETMERNERKITVQDAIFVMERDMQGGRGTNQRTLLRAYNHCK